MHPADIPGGTVPFATLPGNRPHMARHPSRLITVAEAFGPDRPARSAVARGLALFLGGFSIVNILGSIAHGFDANIWWIDLRPLPHPFDALLLASIAAGLIAYGCRPAMGPVRRAVTASLTAAGLLAAIVNAVVFYMLLAGGAIPAAFPIPFSLLIAGSLAAIIGALLGPRATASASRPVLVSVTVAGSLFLFPLMQMFCFGQSDYRRPADVIVVLGAKAYADGTPSVPLADRVRTACDLYRAGLAPRLIFSGGPGDGAVTEPESMRRMALGLGVPDEAIILDEAGLNTQATIENTIPIFERIGARRVMAVSHFYHLPRIKMTYQSDGWEVYTVPAEESYTLRAIPFYMLREVAGLWAYYLRAMGG